MYTLLSGAYKAYFRRDEYFVLIVGLDNAGKSTYVERSKASFTESYKMMNPSKITSTVGLNIGRVDIDGIRLNLWDLGGQEELQSLWHAYYAECDCIIYVIDGADADRFEESKAAFYKTMSSSELDHCPLLIVCNKCDMACPLTVAQVKQHFLTEAILGGRDCKVMSTSALQGTNVAQSITWLTQQVKKRPPRKQLQETT